MARLEASVSGKVTETSVKGKLQAGMRAIGRVFAPFGESMKRNELGRNIDASFAPRLPDESETKRRI